MQVIHAQVTLHSMQQLSNRDIDKSTMQILAAVAALRDQGWHYELAASYLEV
jgi:hypothetical protein